MSELRTCARANCTELAVATMTFQYQQATAVLGKLSPEPIAGALDLCDAHSRTATVPVGWQLITLAAECAQSAIDVATQASDDGLTALADALRESEKQAAQVLEDEHKARRHATGDLPNPWESTFTLPTPRPKFTVLDGGADE